MRTPRIYRLEEDALERTCLSPSEEEEEDPNSRPYHRAHAPWVASLALLSMAGCLLAAFHKQKLQGSAPEEIIGAWNGWALALDTCSILEEKLQTPSPGYFEAVSTGADTACRGDDENDVQESYFVKIMAGSLSACQQKCRMYRNCKGVDFIGPIGVCRVWTRPQGINASKYMPSHSCWTFVAKEAARTGTPGRTPSASKPGTSLYDYVPPSNMSASFASPGTPSKPHCPVCTPQSLPPLDVVIPTYEKDECMFKLVVKSLAVHDPSRLLGEIHVIWVSWIPYSGQLDDVLGMLKKTHTVILHDASRSLHASSIAGSSPGWVAQMIVKLRIALAVKSDYYLALDSKNVFIRDIQPDTFFTECNQAKVFGETTLQKMYQPHASWYKTSASVLGVGYDQGGLWPSSVTPMVMHTPTVLNMLAYIGEPFGEALNLCAGPLCGLFSGMHPPPTEFTLYMMYARAKLAHCFACKYGVVNVKTEAVAMTLWGSQGTRNMDIAGAVVAEKLNTTILGMHKGVLNSLTWEQGQVLANLVARIYQKAQLRTEKTWERWAFGNCIGN
eukprot:TRINITY_DN10290_c0_g1_i3.p1 TRINITY_DN10290_c0_g1~~TRINITY_DN10290_c0_g1_i3.p1  ORF type:complete len:557 (+),score=67.74 TRINITY_DN10290_c0_g1_i3:68-1738(+)